jgi:Tol biopolymer transport system component/DNA-binding winged helix-turn-helix (wHTH) protein
MGPLEDEVYVFGPFRLDVPEKLLSRDRVAVPLEPTQFQVLAVLVREAGHLVSREQLTRAVWRDTYVDEGSLTVTISMLRRALGDTPSQPRYIETVRKSGYRFVARVNRVPRQAGQEEEGVRAGGSHGTGTRLSFAAMALVVVLTGWYWSPSGVNRDPVPNPVPFFPFGGVQDEPSFSPDGSQVAFTWRPPQSNNYDIYVLRIGDLNPTRLTTDPAWDKSPAWSPDGRQIAFIRRKESAGEVILISPAGGPEQKVADTQGTMVTWNPDSRSLAVVDRWAAEDAHSIFLIPAAGGPKRQLTFPAVEKTYGDSYPAISPDGRTLAFVRHLTYDVSDVFVQPLDGGNARRVTFDNRQIRGLAWMPRGQEVIFSSNRNGRYELWRINVGGKAPPRVVEGSSDARFPAISATRSGSGSRLLYLAHIEDYNIRVLNRGAGDASTFAASTRDEQNPRLSPDGRRLAFVSDRTGWFELWVCGYPDASDCRQLTSFSQGYVGSPSWSPDGQRIAFDARLDGNADIYIVRADGGPPVRLTHETSVESRPTWSGDARWIYFRSDRTGAHQIWKMTASGGGARQVTKNGGFEAFESPDGKSLYYVRGRYLHGLSTVPVDGGAETSVPGFGSLKASTWTIIDNGILWIDVTKSNPPAAIRFDDSATREVSTIADVPRSVISSATGFHASRDGAILMWSQLDRSAHELMLVERFR